MKVISTEGCRDLTPEIIGPDGFPMVMPAAYYRNTSVNERAIFGVRNAVYSFVTPELVEWLKQRIAGRTAIEIGSGNGVLAATLGIPATDNLMQTDPAVKLIYATLNQPIIAYGINVEKVDAVSAVRKYMPQVVIACWVTHLYRADRHEAGGNMAGVNEEDIIANCEEYIFIGNEHVHAGKSIWNLPHEKHYFDWLYSRASNGSRDFVATWKGGKSA